MLAEFGFMSLLVSCLLAWALAILAFFVKKQPQVDFAPLARGISVALFASLTLAFALLIALFLQNDFSVTYVANHANSQLPIFYKIAASWGGAEGSMLLLLWLMALWALVFACASQKLPSPLTTYTLAVMGALLGLFSLYSILYTDPFQRLFPATLEGGDLNPMLQDIGLIFHPPLLYLGYSGFALTFALTVAFLIQARSEYFAKIRQYALAAWGFLTLGITLGAWWAYYELGWGGWWFWDPAENASLMPWLVGTALIHSVSAYMKQRPHNGWASWVVFLSLTTFALSVLGIFIVRSGALTSVHAFARDDQRGTLLLLLFLLVSLPAFALFAWRDGKPQPFMRKTAQLYALLANNALLSLAAFVVFLGSFYPMLYQQLGWGSISVGAPYFNGFFLPLIVLVLLAMLVFFYPKVRLSFMLISALLALIFTSLILFFYANAQSYWAWAFIFLFLNLWLGLLTIGLISQKNWAMSVGHLGLFAVIFAATMSSFFSQSIGVALSPTESTTLAKQQFTYKQFDYSIGANFTAELAQFSVKNSDLRHAQFLTTEKRHYDVRNITMSEVAIGTGLWGDNYIVMGDKLGQGRYTFRLQYKPFMLWLWVGALLMACGAFLGIFLRKTNE